jgi:hypothetical protein
MIYGMSNRRWFSSLRAECNNNLKCQKSTKESLKIFTFLHDACDSIFSVCVFILPIVGTVGLLWYKQSIYLSTFSFAMELYIPLALSKLMFQKCFSVSFTVSATGESLVFSLFLSLFNGYTQ